MPHTNPDHVETATLDPLSTEEALQSLDDRAFVELVTDFRERRRWTVEEVHNPGTWHVDLSLHSDWPLEQRALVRIKRPESDKRVSGADVRHFVQTVQGSEVDRGVLVLPAVVSETIRDQAAEYGIDIVDRDDLVRLVNRWSAHDLLAQHVDRPVTPETDPLVDRVPEPAARVLTRFDIIARIEGLLERRLPPNPTADDLARLTFTGFRIALLATAVVFLVTLAATDGSILFWLLLGVFVVVTYVGLLPMMAADIYLVRQFEETRWTPTWLSLTSFLLAPILFVVGGLYWYRRRQRTPSGRNAAW